jgi:hypothetical protein
MARTGRSRRKRVIVSTPSIVAPSYSTPEVLLGNDWGEGGIGTTVDVAPEGSTRLTRSL